MHPESQGMYACVLQIAEEDAVAAHVLTSQEASDAAKSSLEDAHENTENYFKIAMDLQVDQERIFVKALEPEGGASDVSKSIEHYAQSNSIDIVCLGKRGFGSIKRAAMSIVGLGSVSDWCVQNLSIPVVVIPSMAEAHDKNE